MMTGCLGAGRAKKAAPNSQVFLWMREEVRREVRWVYSLSVSCSLMYRIIIQSVCTANTFFAGEPVVRGTQPWRRKGGGVTRGMLGVCAPRYRYRVFCAGRQQAGSASQLRRSFLGDSNRTNRMILVRRTIITQHRSLLTIARCI